jgi:hypothetical protein
VRLVSRLVLNDQLYDPPRVRPASTPGVKPKKGPRQPKLVDRLDATTVAAGHTAWQRQVVAWYGHQRRLLDVATGTALWHTDGCDPLPIRWVLVRDPRGRLSPYALFCTDQEVDAIAVLVLRTGISSDTRLAPLCVKGGGRRGETGADGVTGSALRAGRRRFAWRGGGGRLGIAEELAVDHISQASLEAAEGLLLGVALGPLA